MTDVRFAHAVARMSLLLTVLLGGVWRVAGAQDLDAMAALIRAGQAGEAYRQLAAAEETRAGDVEFDYLLGVAALESGQPARATLAFERVIALEPDHLGARLDMARANFALGQDQLARRQLEELRGMNPPPAAARAIEDYLAALDKRAQPTHWRGFIEAGGGYDSNANNSTSSDGVFVPALGVSVNLDATSTARSDLFFESRAGVEVRHVVNPRLTLRASATGSVRLYDDVTDLDSRDVSGFVGVDARVSRDTISAGVRYGRSKLDYVPYRDLLGLELEWRRPLDARTQVVSFLQKTGLRYQREVDKSSSSDLLLVGSGVQHALDERGRTVVSASVFGGVDDATRGRVDGDRAMAGVRFGAEHLLRDDVTVFVTGGAQFSNYEDANPIFLRERFDRLYDAGAGVQWRFMPQWSVQSQVAWSRNDSNIDIDTYSRTEIAVKLRRTFE